MRKKATDALISYGIPMNQSGFLYILDAMELFSQHGAPFTNMRVVYEIIARKRKHSVTEIMENIKYSLLSLVITTAKQEHGLLISDLLIHRKPTVTIWLIYGKG